MSKREIQYAAGWAAAVMLATCLPYFWVWWTTPGNGFFPLILFNSDDHGVYFAWMRQAQEGRLLFRNLFTTEPQRGVYFHLYFLLLGWLARLPGLTIPLAYHAARVLFGIVTLVLVYRLAALVTPDRFARRCVFWTTALSAGLGWLFWARSITQGEPVDVWQPEALTFPSLYVNGLFAVSLALMLGVVVCLLLAERYGVRWAAAAGLCGLALGNVHSYDVIHLALVWTGYLLLRWLVGRRFPRREVKMALVAALVASPSVAYMAWLYATEPVFKARADTATLSPRWPLYAWGYGLLIPLAAWGAALLWRSVEAPRGDRAERLRRLLPAAWAVMGLAAAYLPFAFQRKMIMGTHLPLALLAGLAVADLSRRLARRVRREQLAGALAALLIAVLSISNVRFVLRDLHLARTENRTSTGLHPAYWLASIIHAFQWMRAHAPEDAALLTWPTNGVLAPAYSGRAVYAGHWGETPRFGERFSEVTGFYAGRGTAAERRAFLKANGITHVLLSPTERLWVTERAGVDPYGVLPRDAFLTPVFREDETILFAVR